MEIRCKLTKRFLVEINIEDYLKNLKRLGISQEIPLRITIPCPKCHKIEQYDIYEKHYKFVGNKTHETIIQVDSSVIVDKC